MSNKEYLQAEFERIVRIRGLNVDTVKSKLGDYLNPHTSRMYGFFVSGFGFGAAQ